MTEQAARSVVGPHTRWRQRLNAGGVKTLAFAADGTLASGSGDQTVKLWDTTTYNERITLRGHQGGVTALSRSPNNQTLASAAIDDAVRLWKLSP